MPKFPAAGVFALVSALVASMYLLRWRKYTEIPVDGETTRQPRYNSNNLPKTEAYMMDGLSALYKIIGY